MAGEYFDSSNSAFMRLKEDGLTDSTSPFILAIQIEK
jgi:hypothetical protein